MEAEEPLSAKRWVGAATEKKCLSSGIDCAVVQGDMNLARELPKRAAWTTFFAPSSFNLSFEYAL